jgi:hypothetical protein
VNDSQPQDDDAQALADLYAGILNDILAAHGEVTEEEFGELQQDANDDGFELSTDHTGQWIAKPLEGQVDSFAEGDWSQQKGPRGGTYWVNRNNPNRKVYGKANPGAAKGDRVKARTEAAKAAGPADRKGLDAKIAEHAKAAGDLTPQEQKSAKLSMAALKRHHGDAVEHRVAELVGVLEKAHAKASAAGNKEAAAAVSRRIAAFGHGLAGAAKVPVSAEVAGAVARDVANDKASQKGEPAPFKSDAKPAAPKSPAKAAPSNAAAKAAPAAKVAAPMDATKRGGDNGGMAKNKLAGKSSAEFDAEDVAVLKEAPLKSKKQFDALRSLLRPAESGDLEKPHIDLWHGTSAAAAKRIIKNNGLNAGPRGTNATADIDHAAEYPEDNGADVLLLLRAKTADLTPDMNDTPSGVADLYGAGKTMEAVREGLFPSGKGYARSSVEIGQHEVVAAFDMREGVNREAAFEALKKGDLLEAIYQGATVLHAPSVKGGESSPAKPAPIPKAPPPEVQEAAEIPDAKPAPNPAAKPAASPPAASSDDDWGTTQVEPGSAESISSTLQMDPQGDGVSERLDKVFDQVKSEVPNLTTAKWKAFLQKAWDTKAVELQGINEVRHIHAAGGMDKVPIKSSGGMDRVLAYAIVKDPKKLQALIQSDLL